MRQCIKALFSGDMTGDNCLALKRSQIAAKLNVAGAQLWKRDALLYYSALGIVEEFSNSAWSCYRTWLPAGYIACSNVWAALIIPSAAPTIRQPSPLR